MKTAGKIFIWVSAALLAVWLIPWLCGIIVAKPVSSPFTLYSFIAEDFLTMDREEGKDLLFTDRKGNVYGDEALPLFYHSVLHSRGAFPDSIGGRAVTRDEVKLHNYNLSEKPANVDRIAAKAYLLMESVPVRLELQDPAYGMVFRKDGLHVYVLEDNSPDSEKSAAFTRALTDAGFVFPASLASGNPTHRKEFDEGYLLTDAEGRLYQLKMVDGQPEVRHFPAADALALTYISIVEVSDHSVLGYLSDTDGRLAVLRPDGTVLPTEVVWNPRKEQLFVVGDMFNHTVKVSDRSADRFYALRSDDFSLIDTMERAYPDPPVNFSRWFLPCRLSFVSGTDGYVRPRVRDFSWVGLAVDLVLLAGVWALRRRRNPQK